MFTRILFSVAIIACGSSVAQAQLPTITVTESLPPGGIPKPAGEFSVVGTFTTANGVYTPPGMFQVVATPLAGGLQIISGFSPSNAQNGTYLAIRFPNLPKGKYIVFVNGRFTSANANANVASAVITIDVP